MGTEQKSQATSGGEGGDIQEIHTCCGCRFPLLVALLQLLLGVAVAVVAFLMTAISPSLLARETPHWAGIILCLVSLLGFVLCCITYLPDETTFIQFITKLLYFLLCSVGLVLSLLVVAFSIHHYVQASSFTCQEKGDVCRCMVEPEDPVAHVFLYTGVTDCSSITDTLRLYYLLQMALSLAQTIVCLVGAFIMWKHRYQVFFAGMEVGSPATQQWQKA